LFAKKGKKDNTGGGKKSYFPRKQGRVQFVMERKEAQLARRGEKGWWKHLNGEKTPKFMV